VFGWGLLEFIPGTGYPFSLFFPLVSPGKCHYCTATINWTISTSLQVLSKPLFIKSPKQKIRSERIKNKQTNKQNIQEIKISFNQNAK
jgi:hypothetical protein